jgi:hypothetical protein
MKTKNFLLSAFMLVGFLAPLSTSAQSVNHLLGDWNAEAPEAPPGFNTSIMTVHEDSVFTTFAGETIIYSSTLIRFNADSLIFEINGLDVLCTLKVEDKNKMTGNAVWEGGETRLFLTKQENPVP